MQEELKLIAQWVRDHGVNVLSDEDALKIPEEALPDKPKIMAIEKVEREGVVEEVEVELTPRKIYMHLRDPSSPLRPQLLQMIKETLEFRERLRAKAAVG